MVINQTINKKVIWMKRKRKWFREHYGYSMQSYYSTGKLRPMVLIRDKYKCVKCGMTDNQHKKKWKRPITLDHIDKNKKNNCMQNLQTLCLKCHGSKDISKKLVIQQVPAYRKEIESMRSSNMHYQDIANKLGFSIASVWKWVQRWKDEPKKVLHGVQEVKK